MEVRYVGFEGRDLRDEDGEVRPRVDIKSRNLP